MSTNGSVPQADPSGNPLPDRATIVAGALDALGPDPNAAAAFWRALPRSTPATALDAALQCVAAGRPVYPVWLIWNAAAGKYDKPAAVDAYYHVAASPVEHGVNDKGRPARFSTLDPDTCRAWWGPGGPFARSGVGAVLGEAFALDADDDDAAAWLAGAVVDAGDTWIIHGGRGARVVYRRPAWIAEAKPDGWRGAVRERDGAAVAGGCDVLGGVLVVWTPGAKRRSWTGGPECIADPSPAIDAALHAALDPRPVPMLAPALGPALSVETARGAAYVRTALTSLRAEVAALADGTHNVGAHRAAVAAGRALGKASRPDMADDALDVLATAAPWASRRRHRETIRRGIAWGLANVEEGLPDRTLPGRLAAAPAAGPDADAIRADIAGRLARLPDDVDQLQGDNGRPLHYRRRLTVKRAVEHIMVKMHDAGRTEHAEPLASIGLAIDRGGAAISGALPYLPRLGFDVTIGGLDDNGTGRATLFALPVPIFAQNRTMPLSAGGGAPAGVLRTHSVLRENTLTEARGVLAAAGDDVTRGLRRRSKPDDKTTGDYSADIVAVLRAAGGPLDAEDVAGAVGCHVATARRGLAAAAERGPVIATRAPATGRGRPRMLFELAEAITPAIEAVCALGAAAKARAVLAIDVARDRLRKARALALRGVGTVRSLLARLTARARAEREAARPGGDRGRPELDRERGARALAAAAAWALDGWRQANPSPAADLETPPAWATEAMPIW